MLPNSLECEKGLLSSILLDPTIVNRISNSEVFYDYANKAIFNLITRVLDSSLACDWNTLVGSADSRTLSEIGGKEYLSSLFCFPSPDNWSHYYQILLDLYDKRQAILHAERIKSLAEDRETKIEEIEQVAALIRKSGIKEDKLTPGSITLKFSQWLEDVYDNKIQERKIEWGFSIDNLLDALVPGELCLIGGRPGSGKTSIANCVASYSCISQGIPALIFSFEMITREVLTRLLSIMTGVPIRRIKNPRNLGTKDWQKVHEGLQTISGSRLSICDEIISIHDIYARCRDKKESGGLDLVVIDYAQLTRSPDEMDKIDFLDEVGIISKRISKEFDCVVMLLTQINREDNSPSFCSSLENHANQFIIVPTSAKNETSKKIFVRKNRNGPIGFVDVGWNGECAAFS